MDRRIAGWSGEKLADVTRSRRAARAVEVREFHAAADAGIWMGRGFRSPSAWLSEATGEPFGACKRTLFLGQGLTHMPVADQAFGGGRPVRAGARAPRRRLGPSGSTARSRSGSTSDASTCRGSSTG